jgi:hypothetical protein
MAKKEFDLVALAAAYARDTGIPLNHPGLAESFSEAAAKRLRGALTDPLLLHGSRTQNLFEAMVVSLGRFQLFTPEDVGRVHSPDRLRAPDFRVVLPEGDQWLIEVKNVRQPDPLNQVTRMTANYLASLERYADLVGVPLRLAFYWSVWNLWTLVPAAPFRTRGGALKIAMQDAMVASELGRLGDVMLWTTPPLRVLIEGSAERQLRMEPDASSITGGASLRIFSRGQELEDPKDRHLALILADYGEWRIEGPRILDGFEHGAAEFISSPEEPSEDGMDGIGSASRIFSRYFDQNTIAGDAVIQLAGEPVPEWFAPIATWDFKNSRLPLWVGYMHPASGNQDSRSD